MILRSMLDIFSPRMFYSSEILPFEDFHLPAKALLLYDGRDELEITAGDRLKTGQRLADGFYSTVTGTLKSVTKSAGLDGGKFLTLEIETAADEWAEAESCPDFLKIPADVLVQRLNNFGLWAPDLHPAETVVVNCMESDLLVCSAGQILRNNPEKIKIGISLIRHLAGAGKVVAAFADRDAGQVRDIAHGIAELVKIKPVYPNGAPGMVAGFAGDYNACVIGAEKLCAMVDAVTAGTPFCRKIVTLIDKTGRPVNNLAVRIGTPVSEILKSENITIQDGEKMIIGGPMRGISIYDPEFPITAAADALMIQRTEDICRSEENPCIGCGRCVNSCPRKIQINLLARFSEFGLFEKCEELHIDSCIECGMCAYVCPARRPLVQFVQFAGNELRKLRQNQNHKQEEQ